MKTVALFYLSPNPYGGWVTFTAHLFRALKAAGLWPSLYKIRPRAERKTRDFGYGISYRNITLHEAVNWHSGPKLIVAAAKKFQVETAALIDDGAYLVLHDPTELKNLPPIPGTRTIVIRRAGLSIVPEAKFIRHPYVRGCKEVWPYPRRKVHAASTARIDFDKHTEIILQANRQLPKEKQVQLHGFENRIYGKFTLMPRFPEWKKVQSTHKFERKMGVALEFLRPAKFAVDMSEIKGDGGGSQYTFLEAWDAGALVVINEAWIRDFPDDDMEHGRNCLAVADAAALVKLLNRAMDTTYFQRQGIGQLEAHDPELIGRLYARVLGLA